MALNRHCLRIVLTTFLVLLTGGRVLASVRGTSLPYCYWVGTGPSCEYSTCRPDEYVANESRLGGDGYPCITGKKKYCCKDSTLMPEDVSLLPVANLRPDEAANVIDETTTAAEMTTTNQITSTASSRQHLCYWAGTAPSCDDGWCQPGEYVAAESRKGADGVLCDTGKKRYCCKMRHRKVAAPTVRVYMVHANVRNSQQDLQPNPEPTPLPQDEPHYSPAVEGRPPVMASVSMEPQQAAVEAMTPSSSHQDQSNPLDQTWPTPSVLVTSVPTTSMPISRRTRPPMTTTTSQMTSRSFETSERDNATVATAEPLRTTISEQETRSPSGEIQQTTMSTFRPSSDDEKPSTAGQNPQVTTTIITELSSSSTEEMKIVVPPTPFPPTPVMPLLPLMTSNESQSETADESANIPMSTYLHWVVHPSSEDVDDRDESSTDDQTSAESDQMNPSVLSGQELLGRTTMPPRSAPMTEFKVVVHPPPPNMVPVGLPLLNEPRPVGSNQQSLPLTKVQDARPLPVGLESDESPSVMTAVMSTSQEIRAPNSNVFPQRESEQPHPFPPKMTSGSAGSDGELWSPTTGSAAFTPPSFPKIPQQTLPILSGQQNVARPLPNPSAAGTQQALIPTFLGKKTTSASPPPQEPSHFNPSTSTSSSTAVEHVIRRDMLDLIASEPDEDKRPASEHNNCSMDERKTSTADMEEGGIPEPE